MYSTDELIVLLQKCKCHSLLNNPLHLLKNVYLRFPKVLESRLVQHFLSVGLGCTVHPPFIYSLDAGKAFALIPTGQSMQHQIAPSKVCTNFLSNLVTDSCQVWAPTAHLCLQIVQSLCKQLLHFLTFASVTACVLMTSSDEVASF